MEKPKFDNRITFGNLLTLAGLFIGGCITIGTFLGEFNTLKTDFAINRIAVNGALADLRKTDRNLYSLIISGRPFVEQSQEFAP